MIEHFIGLKSIEAGCYVGRAAPELVLHQPSRTSMTDAIELHTNQNLHPQHALLVSTKSSADLERSRVQMTSDPKRGAFRYRARVMYDGLQYFGMQYQPRGPSVAGTLQHTIARRCQQTVAIVAASRTDTGVHARGQAVHFDLDTEYDSRELEYSINR
eukprot:5316788-Pleurochrysis_carterae.AAC.2